NGTTPPTQRPLRLEAPILSRMRSEVTSRSNWAKDSKTLSVSLPIEVVVLNCWVTETKDTPWASNSSPSLAKSAKERRNCLAACLGQERDDRCRQASSYENSSS